MQPGKKTRPGELQSTSETQGRRELQKSGGSESPICPQFSGNSLFIAFLCDNFLDFPKSGGSADPSDPLVTTPLKGLASSPIRKNKLHIKSGLEDLHLWSKVFKLHQYLLLYYTGSKTDAVVGFAQECISIIRLFTFAKKANRRCNF